MPECTLSRAATIEKNLGLVHSCAHRFKGRGLEYDDLFQAGCMGLCKAVDAFDRNRGVMFSTYAVPVILGEMRRLFRDGGSVKVSRSLKELSLKATRTREIITAKTGHEPTIGELAVLLGHEPAEIAEAIAAGAPPISLTENEDEGGGQIDVPIPSPEEEMADTISLNQVMDKLPLNDKRLIVLRYYGGKTQMQTASILGMTQVQVSRREKKILLHLRQELTG
ncbi:MAG: sigma-70 family RNA polymerase sigma factor [Hydrogenoanaerobacterium sp.]